MPRIFRTSEFTANYTKLIPIVQESELLKAKLYLENDIKPLLSEGKKYTQKEFVKMFQSVLDQYSLNYKIELSKDTLTRMKVTSKNKIIINARTEKLTENQIKKLIAHEIETHAITYQNGNQQPYKIFNYGFANYIELQEGLAIYNQEKIRSKT